MSRAIGSKINLKDTRDELAAIYMECVDDIINHEKVKKLDLCKQHNNTSRLQHSINVSYYSFVICKRFGWDYKSVARAGLMHDLYFYDWRTKKTLRSSHASWHPRVSVDNAKKICELNKIEEDCIIKHMWPCTMKFPKYKESYVLTFVDKICACFEFFIESEAVFEVAPSRVLD